MSQRVAKVRGESLFKAATMGPLILMLTFFVGIIVAIIAHTDWNTLLSALFSREILFAIKLSLITATVATIIAVCIAIPAAHALSKADFRCKAMVDTILDLPIVLSPVALGAALLVFFNTPLGRGIENNIMRFVFEVPGIILAQFTVVSALAIRLLKSTFDDIDPRYEQVGRTLGYGRLGVFFRVVLPLAKNGLLAAFILTWARAVGEFGATVTLVGATPFKTETLPIAIFLCLSSADVERAIAVILVLITIAAGTLLFIRKIGDQQDLI